MNGTSRGEIIDEASSWLVGGGIVTMALFPLALPGIVLAAAAAIPLLALGLAAGVLALAVIVPIRLVRALIRLMTRQWPERAGIEVGRLSPVERCG
jgi:hypothetical protein